MALTAPPVSWPTWLGQRLTIYTAKLIMHLLKFTIKLFDLRAGIVPASRSIKPARHFVIPSSKDPSRRIRVNVHEPAPSESIGEKETQYPRPVYINLHGSGFVLPCFGFDAELCTYWADTLNCTVLDADYAKAPSHPYPAAIDDASDVIAHVLSHPESYDTSRIVLGGASAGANVALMAALRLPEEKKNDVIKSLVIWYPPTNLARYGVGRPETGFGIWSYKAFRQAYTPPGVDLTDPRVSPMYAPSAAFPPIIFIVGEDDPLLLDSVELARKLKADGHDDCELITIPNAGHAWEWFVKESTPQWDARRTTLKRIEERLRKVFEGEGNKEDGKKIDS